MKQFFFLAEKTRGRPQNTIEDFFDKINKTDTCWLWNSYVDKDGYGKFRFNKKDHRAHRFSYILYKGIIPKDLCICHFCDQPACVNPNHLWVGTKKENNQDRALKNRSNNQNKSKTSCPQGHKYDEQNTLTRTKKNGRLERRCRVCNKVNQKKSYYKTKEYITI